MRFTDINYLVAQLLDVNIHEQQYLCEEILRNVDYFDTVKGVLSKENAERIVAACMMNKKLEPIAAQVLYFSDEKTISDSLFERIIHYPRRKTRHNFLIALGHCTISIYQQHYICSLKICGESFANLLHVYLVNNCFTKYDLQHLVSCNMEFIQAIDISAILDESIIDDEKKNYLSTLI